MQLHGKTYTYTPAPSSPSFSRVKYGPATLQEAGLHGPHQMLPATKYHRVIPLLLSVDPAGPAQTADAGTLAEGVEVEEI